MNRRSYTIKNGEIIITTTIKIDDYSILLRYNMNLTCLVDDIRRAKKDEVLENFLLKAEELFAEEVEKAKPRKNSPLGNHSIFYYMYGHMNDWIRYAEKELIKAKAMLTLSYNVEDFVHIIKTSRDPEDAVKNLMDALGLDEFETRFVLGLRSRDLTRLMLEKCKESVEFLEKRLSKLKELAKYD